MGVLQASVLPLLHPHTIDFAREGLLLIGGFSIGFVAGMLAANARRQARSGRGYSA